MHEMVFRLLEMIDILELSRFSEEMREDVRKEIEEIGKQPIHIWRADHGKVILKTRWAEAVEDDDWEGEDWDGDDDSCIFTFDRREFGKQRRWLIGESDQEVFVPRRDIYLRDDNKFFYPRVNWTEISSIASELIKKFEGSTEIHLNYNYFSKILQQLERSEHNGHCEILELNYDEANEQHLDAILREFQTVDTVLLGTFNGSLLDHHVFNYKTIIVNTAENIQRAELLHLQRNAIELINPLSLENDDIAAFIEKWKSGNDTEFGMLKLEFIDEENHFDLDTISKELGPVKYEEDRRDELEPKIDSVKTSAYSFLFAQEDCLDFVRPDGLTATLTNHRSSTYFVVWHV